ncbi:MAG: RagB/SusD family nutrient uptake outer membrane protein, partial [Paramuribaculum sp.]
INNIPADPRLDKIYAEKLDYTVSPLLREVRRERRVEMMMEGLRREDLIRWKAGRLMEVPLRGMKFTEEKQAIYDGSNKDKDTRKTAFAYQAKLDTDVFVDADGFIIGFPKASRITDGTLVWDNKYYYFPIPLQELSLNPNLTQSPGWQDIPRN